MLKRNPHSFLLLLVAIDLLTLAAAWVIAFGLRVLAQHLRLSHHPVPPFAQVVPYMLVSLILCPLVFSRSDLYAPKRTISLMREVVNVLAVVIPVWALTYVIVSLVRQTLVSRIIMLTTLAVWLVLASLVRVAGRVVLRNLRSRGYNLRHAAIVGSGRLGQRLALALARNAWTGIKVGYFLDDAPAERKIKNLDVLGPVDDLERILHARPVDIVFVAMSDAPQERIEHVVNRLSAAHVDLRVVPDFLALQLLRHEVAVLDDMPIISLTQSPQQGWNSFLKALVDYLLSLAALLVLAAPMLAIALAVRLTSRGPVLYRQVRVGLGGRPFALLKFRTMRADAEAATGPVWAVPDDPRVTRVGRFLRRTSLDELPQLFNVLRGDMSLVGPRPERPELIAQFKDRIPRYMLRHHVKAGITGWAQIHGMRGNTSLHKRVRYDLYYIRYWSFGLDLWILLLTPFRGLFHPNAY